VTSSWILGFDTATRATAVALVNDQGDTFEARDDPPRGRRPRHAARLLALCADVLERAGVGYEELQKLAVGVGPGTFTGLRIGVATARALAQASAVPLVGVSTLQSLALNALGVDELQPVEAVAAVLDARRGEAFAAVWPIDGPERDPLIAPSAFTPEALVKTLDAGQLRLLALGEGAIEFRAALEGSGVLVPDDEAQVHRVTATGHCRLARRLPPADPADITPQYLRLPDAEIARRGAQ